MIPPILTHNQSISHPHGFHCVFRGLCGPIRRPASHLWYLALFQHSAPYRAPSNTRDAGLDKILHPSSIREISKIVHSTPETNVSRFSPHGDIDCGVRRQVFSYITEKMVPSACDLRHHMYLLHVFKTLAGNVSLPSIPNFYQFDQNLQDCSSISRIIPMDYQVCHPITLLSSFSNKPV